MKDNIVIYWFRQDLRLSDNPALCAASKAGRVLPLYILDDYNSESHKMGQASRVWLHKSLKLLDDSLDNYLSIYNADPIAVLKRLCSEYNVTDIYWNRCYEPWRVKRDKNIKENLQENNINVHSYNGSLLWEPWNVVKDNGDPYKVFTPFYRKGCLGAKPPREPILKPDAGVYFKDPKHSIGLEDLNLLPNNNWHQLMIDHCKVGESAAQQKLDDFIEVGLSNYKDGRNFPACPFVSRLSANIHFGEISPNQLWYTIKDLYDDANSDHFCSELGWREFSYSQLYFNQDLPCKNLQQKFDNFPWKDDEVSLKAWQEGKTGIPMVDAGMRELYQTGFMHNRVRMVVGSFLVKNLCLDWRYGERWFWDCLVDADLASNSASWQWVAGCGADASPYFRIFNPVTQGQKFDSDGEYVRKYVPEIAKLPNKFLFSPWEAPLLILKESGIVLGDTYPKPIVDLKKSREYALAAFASLKKEQND